mgnify:FL=1
MTDSLFTQIYKGQIPGKVIYEDEQCFAINDINPQAPVHILIIPKKEVAKVSDASFEEIPLLGHLIYISKKLADLNKLSNNYRLVINNGAEAGQSVFHIHVHLLGGRSFNWPPG